MNARPASVSHRHASRRCALMVAAALALPALWGCATNRAQEDRSATSQALRKLPRKTQEQRVAVAVYEVSSGLPELPARGATEMFKTALLKSGQFRVVERAKLSRGVVAEKQLNAAGQTTGTSAQQPLRGAEYIFQAEITEVNAGADNSSTGINIAGLQLGRGNSSDTIGLDISIVDANTGEVVDAVNVRRALGGSSASVSGVGTLVSRVMIERGKTPSAYTPEIEHNSARKDSLDVGLRECLEEGVRLLALRFDAATVR
ncbi:CsgG/HfaB family protein [Ideonella sp. DXS29W]|uniref:CsgG/HfaB family protein n=1 Tax=Ideonella lacteola TaxID=2984193 RepID=A0ABU9BVJ9_9BURK